MEAILPDNILLMQTNTENLQCPLTDLGWTGLNISQYHIYHMINILSNIQTKQANLIFCEVPKTYNKA